jgi:tetraacyldisaccharide 4'-kinase
MTAPAGAGGPRGGDRAHEPGGAAGWLQRQWWRPQPGAAATLLRPLAALYGALARRHRARTPAERLSVPVVVVGNIVVGGAGKTPAVIALVQALQARGHRPGVVSRGYGRRDAGAGTLAVHADTDPVSAGDEPVLIARRCGVPVQVGRDRVAAARALLQAHPEVDCIVADDGLQHHALARDAELLVFDQRGVGNGLLLPAGPLREPLPRALAPRQRVLYSAGVASTPLPGALATRTPGRAWPLHAWRRGDGSAAVELGTLRGSEPLLAAAGLAAPEKFFAMLEAAGLRIHRLPLPDHHAYATLPWPAATPAVITTEKDAVKLDPARVGTTRVWVVPLDSGLPAALVDDLCALLFGTSPRAPTTAPLP